VLPPTHLNSTPNCAHSHSFLSASSSTFTGLSHTFFFLIPRHVLAGCHHDLHRISPCNLSTHPPPLSSFVLCKEDRVQEFPSDSQATHRCAHGSALSTHVTLFCEGQQQHSSIRLNTVLLSNPKNACWHAKCATSSAAPWPYGKYLQCGKDFPPVDHYHQTHQ